MLTLTRCSLIDGAHQSRHIHQLPADAQALPNRAAFIGAMTAALRPFTIERAAQFAEDVHKQYGQDPNPIQCSHLYAAASDSGWCPQLLRYAARRALGSSLKVASFSDDDEFVHKCLIEKDARWQNYVLQVINAFQHPKIEPIDYIWLAHVAHALYDRDAEAISQLKDDESVLLRSRNTFALYGKDGWKFLDGVPKLQRGPRYEKEKPNAHLELDPGVLFIEREGRLIVDDSYVPDYEIISEHMVAGRPQVGTAVIVRAKYADAPAATAKLMLKPIAGCELEIYDRSNPEHLDVALFLCDRVVKFKLHTDKQLASRYVTLEAHP